MRKFSNNRIVFYVITNVVNIQRCMNYWTIYSNTFSLFFIFLVFITLCIDTPPLYPQDIIKEQ